MQPSPNKVPTTSNLIALVRQYVIQTTDQVLTSIKAIANHLKQVSRQKILTLKLCDALEFAGLTRHTVYISLRNIETL